MTGRRTQYDAAFKLEIAQMVIDQGLTVAEWLHSVLKTFTWDAIRHVASCAHLTSNPYGAKQPSAVSEIS